MADSIKNLLVPVLYLISSVLFIVGIKGLASVRTARRGNGIAAIGMLLAIVGTLLEIGLIDFRWILIGLIVGSAIGAVVAVRVPMTSMPEMVGLLNGCGGAASLLVAISYVSLKVLEPKLGGTLAALEGGDVAITTAFSILVGGVTASGSLLAFLKLGEYITGRPILIPGRHALNLLLFLAALAVSGYVAYIAATPAAMLDGMLVLTAISLVLGVTLVIAIGGADMPVVISLLNSYSGIAACATGFVLHNNLLIIAGALVGASGIILTQIMCKAMNRTMVNVVFGGFGVVDAQTGGGKSEYTNVRSCGAEEAAMVLEAAETVSIVPGYGLAVAQAQHTIRELADLLKKNGTRVSYAIHPVAGRMPGHMNVLLAEANVPYDELIEMDQANPELKNTDVVIVVGANDVVNPAASDPKSPIAGMPVLEVWNAKTVIVLKRSLSPGFAGIKNELFEMPNTLMLFEDAKKGLQGMVNELKAAKAA